MRLALLSDIHSNLPALEAVLADTRRRRRRRDLVPRRRGRLRRAAGRVRRRSSGSAASVCLVGNHDLAALERLDISTFSPAAAAAVRWTRERMSRRDPRRSSPGSSRPTRAARSASTTPPRATRSGSTCSGPTRRPSASAPRRAGSASSATRTSRSSSPSPRRRRQTAPTTPAGAQAGAGTSLEVGRGRWLINPGSVGQPRDGDPRAAWLELDTEAWHATFHRVALRHRPGRRRDRRHRPARAPRPPALRRAMSDAAGGVEANY